MAHSHRRRHTRNREDSRGAHFLLFIPVAPWFVWEWLPDVIRAWVYRLRGSEAVAALAAAVIAAAAVLAFYGCNREVHKTCIGTVVSQSWSA